MTSVLLSVGLLIIYFLKVYAVAPPDQAVAVESHSKHNFQAILVRGGHYKALIQCPAKQWHHLYLGI